MNILILLSLITPLLSLQINTRLGNITGIEDVRNSVTFYSFYGIPYAKPPVGANRFMKAVPRGPFGNHNGIMFGNACPQSLTLDGGRIVGNEDCLVLNIRTPTLSKTNLKPVMVWIHGGGLTSGTANAYPADVIVTDKDVVVVAINYRLGFLGFPPVRDDDNITNNLGFWDQLLALQWVRDNIDEFGGDKSKITIFGESAGATSVMSLVWSHHSNTTLFQRAIGQSPWLTVFHMFDKKPFSLQQFGSRYNCSSDNLASVMSCLRRVDTSVLAILPIPYPGQIYPGMMMDSKFFPDNFLELMTSALLDTQNKTRPPTLAHIGQYDVMFGWNNNDALVLQMMIPNSSTELSDATLGAYLHATVSGLDDMTMFPFISDLLLQTYKQSIPPRRIAQLSDKTHNELNLEIWKHVAGDVWFAFPAIRTLRLHDLFRSNTRGYLYEFSMRRSYQGIWNTVDWLRDGADHGDEVVLLFGLSRIDPKTRKLPLFADSIFDINRMSNLTSAEEKMSKIFLDYWISFAVNGTPETSVADRDWLEYGSRHSTGLITANSTRNVDGIRNEVYNMMTGLDRAITKYNERSKPKMSTIERQVQLEAEYPIKCQSLSKISLKIIDSYLLQHTQNIRKYCPVCQIHGSPSPLIQCTNDNLIASWNTGITENHQVMSSDIRNKLHSALVEFQSKYPVMDITIFSTLARTVPPIKHSDGLNLRVLIKTTCADKEFQYNKQYDVCERARQ